jgi:ubiquinone/menaquinone biosynthesis C-methylase UbiE
MSRESTREYFERIAPVWDYWHHKNRFYHRKMTQLIRGMVRPRGRVLELGSGTGDLLAALEPTAAIGLNVAETLTLLARRKHPQSRASVRQ